MPECEVGANSLSLPPKHKHARSPPANTVSFPVIGPIQQVCQLLHEPAGTQQSSSGQWLQAPGWGNQLTPAGCTDGAAGQNFTRTCVQDSWRVHLLEEVELGLPSYLAEPKWPLDVVGIQANCLGDLGQQEL